MKADQIILTDFNEGVWPSLKTASPWMGRQMREKIGLEDYDVAAGLVAREVESYLMASEVIITRAGVKGRYPQVPSRWWVRLLCLREECEVEVDSVHGWLDAFASPVKAMGEAKPPPRIIAKRSRNPKVWINDIDQLVNDPFSYYAYRVLALKRPGQLEKEVDKRTLGEFVHNELRDFVRKVLPRMDKDASAATLVRVARQHFVKSLARDFGNNANFAFAIWRAYLDKLAASYIDHFLSSGDRDRSIETEKVLQAGFRVEGEEVMGAGRVDRLDRFSCGRIEVLDYKTGGIIPGSAQYKSGEAPQMGVLQLLAGEGSSEVNAVYLHADKSGVLTAKKLASMSPQDWQMYRQRLVRFLHSCIFEAGRIFEPGPTRYDKYADLSRRLEWSLFASEAGDPDE